jgi:4'-phosphopantetheinyl transferase EntD
VSDVCCPGEALGLAAARLLPAHVLSAAALIDGAATLQHQAERELVARAVEKRRSEFATGRALAHRLLGQWGAEDAPLLPELRRAPAWPAGLLGSISHSVGLCVVAVACKSDCSAIGLDIEGAAPLKPKLWRHILREEERAELEQYSEAEAGRRAKLAFSAKECFYKALSPSLNRVLNFEDVRLTLHEDGSYAGQLLVEDAGIVLHEPLQGRWATVGDVVLTTLVLTQALG